MRPRSPSRSSGSASRSFTAYDATQAELLATVGEFSKDLKRRRCRGAVLCRPRHPARQRELHPARRHPRRERALGAVRRARAHRSAARDREQGRASRSSSSTPAATIPFAALLANAEPHAARSAPSRGLAPREPERQRRDHRLCRRRRRSRERRRRRRTAPYRGAARRDGKTRRRGRPRCSAASPAGSSSRPAAPSAPRCWSGSRANTTSPNCPPRVIAAAAPVVAAWPPPPRRSTSSPARGAGGRADRARRHRPRHRTPGRARRRPARRRRPRRALGLHGARSPRARSRSPSTGMGRRPSGNRGRRGSSPTTVSARAQPIERQRRRSRSRSAPPTTATGSASPCSRPARSPCARRRRRADVAPRRCGWSTPTVEELVYWVIAPRPGGELFAEFDLPRPGTYWLQFADGTDAGLSPERFPVDAELRRRSPTASSPTTASTSPRHVAARRHLPAQHPAARRPRLVRVHDRRARRAARQPQPACPRRSTAPSACSMPTASSIVYWVAAPRPGGDTVAVLDLPKPGVYYLEIADGGNDARSTEPLTLTTRFAPEPRPLRAQRHHGAGHAGRAPRASTTMAIFPRARPRLPRARHRPARRAHASRSRRRRRTSISPSACSTATAPKPSTGRRPRVPAATSSAPSMPPAPAATTSSSPTATTTPARSSRSP